MAVTVEQLESRLEQKVAKKRGKLSSILRRQDSRRKAAVGAYAIAASGFIPSWEKVLVGALQIETVSTELLVTKDRHGEPLPDSERVRRQIICGAIAIKYSKKLKSFQIALQSAIEAGVQSQDTGVVEAALFGKAIGSAQEEQMAKDVKNELEVLEAKLQKLKKKKADLAKTARQNAKKDQVAIEALVGRVAWGLMLSDAGVRARLDREIDATKLGKKEAAAWSAAKKTLSGG
jgi:hypothetical protein